MPLNGFQKGCVVHTRALHLADMQLSGPRRDVHSAVVSFLSSTRAYDQVGFPNLELQVHNSWLFSPFHRLYVHFVERILGKLIGDESFAIPFWNWDAPKGMIMPPNIHGPIIVSLRQASQCSPTSLPRLSISTTTASIPPPPIVNKL
ncbi:hypothetical protein MRB53_021123 [Persea americana]|uniref:Uncharacterized protein n=1 Tax=Persea americana TaxID=3435 RepID=A0ACC2L3R8_PERAE|nr:hypothetical protein MRB53_021123 [Persea americana]